MLKSLTTFFSLFGSLSTLVCCALPAAFVALGAGATFASLIATFPQLIWISEHKFGVFIFGGTMLILGGFMQWRARSQPCPIDPKLAAACKSSRNISFVVHIFSLILYTIGALFAFVLPRLLQN